MTRTLNAISLDRGRTLLALGFGLVAACGGGGGGGDDAADAGSCAPGAAGCECAAGNVCDEGLSCGDGLCGGGVELPPVSFPAAARSCEILLVEDDQGDAAVIGVDFADNTTGAFVREAPRVAIALHANGDAPMGELVVRVASDGQAPEAEVVTCFDAHGELVEDVELGLGG